MDSQDCTGDSTGRAIWRHWYIVGAAGMADKWEGYGNAAGGWNHSAIDGDDSRNPALPHTDLRGGVSSNAQVHDGQSNLFLQFARDRGPSQMRPEQPQVSESPQAATPKTEAVR